MRPGFRGRGRGRPELEPINDRLLRIKEVRLIDSEGKQVGVIPTREALDMAKAVDLDLVLVAPNADPPVARIVNHGKYKYEQAKIKKENKRKPQEVKGIKLRPNTAEHDLQVLVRNARKFLTEGHKVRVVCLFRARELAHPEVGKGKLKVISDQLEDLGKLEREPALAGREMVIVLTPKPVGTKKNAKVEDKQDGGEAV